MCKTKMLSSHYRDVAWAPWRHKSSETWLLCCNCMLGQIWKNTSKLTITGLSWGNPSVTGVFPLQKVHTAESFLWHDFSGDTSIADSLEASIPYTINKLTPRQNGRHFADDIFKYIFFNDNLWVSIKMPLNFSCKGTNNTIPSLDQIIAWRRSGDKPLSESMMARFQTHICVTQPQSVNTVSYWLTAPHCQCNRKRDMPEALCNKTFWKIFFTYVPK